MSTMKNAAISAAVLTACYSKRSSCANALQASPSFSQNPRGHNIAHRYLDEDHPFTFTYAHSDEGHPFTYDPTSGVRIDGMGRTDAPNNRFFELGQPLEEVEEHTPERQRRIVPRRRSKLAPRSLSSSMLQTRRKSQDLLTFDEEKEIAQDIQNFKAVTRARDHLSDWMSREYRVGPNHPQSEPSEYQWASACSLSVDQLHTVVARGQDARTRLIKANVGLVTMIAKRYHNMLRNGGMDRSSGGGAGGTDATLKLDDLVQEGHMGIMEAAERFDPTRGCRFSTYATHWIRQRIVRSIAESARMIRLPVHVQTMIRNMHKKRREIEAQIGRPPSMPELAHEMDVPLDKINLYQHLSKNVLSLELPVDRHSNTEDKRTLGDRVACTEMASPDEDYWSEALRGEVHACLDALGHDERLVLTQRYGLDDGRPKSVRETAEGMGVSSDIARTLEAKALNKLRQPRMNYRLKDYVGKEPYGGDSDYAERHHSGTHHHDCLANNMEEQPQHYYHYPHHMNVARSNTIENTNDEDQGAYERATPESIWGV
jgi:RNA polymerase nonessential primary-like sigma factor